MAWGTTDDSLKTFFSQIGDVVSATVLTDRFSGKSRGFGFVEMASDELAREAIAKLNGQALDGRNIVVNEARPQAARDDRGGGNFDRSQSRGDFRGNRGRRSY